MADKTISVEWKTVFPILLIEASSIISIYYFAMIAYKVNNLMSSIEVFVIIIIVIFANISTFYLLENQIRLQQSKDMLINLQTQYKLQKEHYSELKDNMIATNQSTHDIKNFVTVLSAYIKAGENERAKEKIEEFYGKIPVMDKIITDNIAVNALIQSKIHIIEGIIPAHSISIILPDKLLVDEIDICILLGNAIDNAIKASLSIQNITERSLIIKIFPANNQISILIENSALVKTELKPFFESPRSHEFRHGFGIKNMKNIVDKYGGNLAAEQIQNKFIVSALLPN